MPANSKLWTQILAAQMSTLEFRPIVRLSWHACMLILGPKMSKKLQRVVQPKLRVGIPTEEGLGHWIKLLFSEARRRMPLSSSHSSASPLRSRAMVPLTTKAYGSKPASCMHACIHSLLCWPCYAKDNVLEGRRDTKREGQKETATERRLREREKQKNTREIETDWERERERAREKERQQYRKRKQIQRQREK